MTKTRLYHDNFQNYKRYGIPGSGSTLRAAQELGRNSYGFEVSTKYYREAVEKMILPEVTPDA